MRPTHRFLSRSLLTAALFGSFASLGAGCGSKADAIIGKSFEADATTYEVVGDSFLTDHNAQLAEAAGVSYMLTFFKNDLVQLHRGKGAPIEGKYEVTASGADGLEVSLDFDEDYFGDGTATLSQDGKTLEVKLEMKVMTQDDALMFVIPQKMDVAQTYELHGS